MKITSDIEPSEMPVIDSRTMQSIIRQVTDQVLGVHRDKGAEYSGDVNALDNFERQARELNLLPEKVLWVYMNKHIDSIRSYVNGLEQRVASDDRLIAQLPKLSEPITGRIMDVIAYMCLLTGQYHRRALQEQALFPPEADENTDPKVEIESVSAQRADWIVPVQHRCRITIVGDQGFHMEKDVMMAPGDTYVLTVAQPVLGGAGGGSSYREDDVTPMSDRERITPVPGTLVATTGAAGTLPQGTASYLGSGGRSDFDFEPPEQPAPWSQVKDTYALPTLAHVSEQDGRLTVGRAAYGQLFVLHYGVQGNQTHDAVNSDRQVELRVLAKVDENRLLVLVNSKVQTFDLSVVEVRHFTTNGLFDRYEATLSGLPTLGDAFAMGVLTSVSVGADGTWVATLSNVEHYEQLQVDLDLVAYQTFLRQDSVARGHASHSWA